MITRIFATLVLSLVPVFGFAQSMQRGTTVEVNAIVRSVDAETRKIVLDNETTGETETIVAGPEVVNFDQIKIGDKVKAIYTLGVAARMAMPGELDSSVSIDGQAEKGAKPGAVSATSVTTIVEFVSFDAAASTAVVKDGKGMERVIEVKSDAGRKMAEELKAGDKVALIFTGGLALGIVQE